LPEPLPDGYQSEICLDLPGWLKTITEAWHAAWRC
jgi:hypothetical protein